MWWDGKRQRCLTCKSRDYKKWREANKEDVKARNRAAYLANRDQRLAYSKQWKKENRERYRAITRRRYHEDRVRIRAKWNAWVVATKFCQRRIYLGGRCRGSVKTLEQAEMIRAHIARRLDEFKERQRLDVPQLNTGP